MYYIIRRIVFPKIHYVAPVRNLSDTTMVMHHIISVNTSNRNDWIIYYHVSSEGSQCYNITSGRSHRHILLSH